MAYVVDAGLIPDPADRALSPRAQGGHCLFRPAGADAPPGNQLRVVYPRAAALPERWTRIY